MQQAIYLWSHNGVFKTDSVCWNSNTAVLFDSKRKIDFNPIGAYECSENTAIWDIQADNNCSKDQAKLMIITK